MSSLRKWKLHQVLVVILLNTLIQEIKREARALWKKACVWFWKGKVRLLQRGKIIPHIPFCCLRMPFSFCSDSLTAGLWVSFATLCKDCNLAIYADMYVNENLRFAESNKSCVRLLCRVSYPQLVSGWVYLLLAEPVKSIIYNCFKESDIVIQLSRMFPSTKNFKQNELSLGWRFCQYWFPCLGVGTVIIFIRYSFYWWCNTISLTEIIYPDPFMWKILICLSILPCLSSSWCNLFYSDQRQLSGAFIFRYL